MSQAAHLQDLVTPLIAESGLWMESSQDVGILILGDSADRNLAFDMCLAAATEVSNTFFPLFRILQVHTLRPKCAQTAALYE